MNREATKGTKKITGRGSPRTDDEVASVNVNTSLESNLGLPEVVVSINPGPDSGIVKKPAPPTKPKDPSNYLVIKMEDVVITSL